MLEFDESFYLRNNPDVAEAVRRGEWQSGLTHYCVTGKSQGRIAFPLVDAQWYVSTYPRVSAELAAGIAVSPEDHYHRYGRFRGYLPAPTGPRNDNPAAFPSRAGGLWTDVANALDIIAGRLDLGQINAPQALLLRKWVTDGYVILPQAVAPAALAGAEADLDRAYRGNFEDLRFEVHGIGQNMPWSPETRNGSAKAMDLHWKSQAIRRAIFSPEILAFLHLIFERRVLASQSLGFWRGSAQEAHQDSAYVNYSAPMQFAASWIALEDVKEGAGELFYYVGSHRMPDFLYAGLAKGADEAKRLTSGGDLSQDYPRHIELIRHQAAGIGLTTERFLAKRGDVLIWSADLAHGGGRISTEQTRKSVVTHYCPAELAPHYFETKPGTQVRPYAETAFYSSSIYR